MTPIRAAEDSDHAQAAIKRFANDFAAKWSKAVTKTVDDAEELLTLFDFPRGISAALEDGQPPPRPSGAPSTHPHPVALVQAGARSPRE